MTKSKLCKVAILLSSLVVLSGGLGIDTAYARGGGGFGVCSTRAGLDAKGPRRPLASA